MNCDYCDKPIPSDTPDRAAGVFNVNYLSRCIGLAHSFSKTRVHLCYSCAVMLTACTEEIYATTRYTNSINRDAATPPVVS